MKIKLFIIVIIIIVLCTGLGIYYDTVAQHDKEKLIYGRYVLIDKIGNGINGFSRLVYDKDTYIMYVFNDETMSPYYIVKDKEAIVAIYNVNWFAK